MMLRRWRMRRSETRLRFSREVPEEPLSVDVTSSLLRDDEWVVFDADCVWCSAAGL